MIKQKPSEVSDAYWIAQTNREINYPPFTDRSGKWLIFVDKGEPLDNAWMEVEKALLEGKLGCSAKVSTNKPNPTSSNDKQGVICVYTYDLDDLEDTRRVRKELRKIGFVQKLHYKLDSDVGRYAKDGEKNLTQLFE